MKAKVLAVAGALLLGVGAVHPVDTLAAVQMAHPWQIQDANHFTAPCSVNGHAFPSCLLDTGGSVALMVSPQEAAAAGLSGANTGQGIIGATGVAEAASTVPNTPLRVGAETVPVQTMILPTYQGLPTIGLPAMAALGRYMTLDFATGEVVFFTPPTH